ncbi:MAG: type II toxin-antitoxin system VapC family toxin [Pseudomonadota bacterium]
MIVVDTSVLIAIALGEPEAIAFKPILAASKNKIGWHSLLKAKMALAKHSPASPDTFLMAITRQPNVDMVGFTEKFWPHAAIGFERFGKGRHEASLSYGDCMTYALAVGLEAPLLFKDSRFNLTDLRVHQGSITD